MLDLDSETRILSSHQENNDTIKMRTTVLKLLLVVTICTSSKADSDKERQGCGWRNQDGVGFKTEAEENASLFGEFPWMAAILKIEKTGVDKSTLNIYIGGGSLIHPSVLLTAAHVVQNDEPGELKTRAGEWDTQTTKEIYPHQDRDVASIQMHEAYNKGTLTNDIALLFLDKPVDLAPNVGLACLPPPQQKVQPGTKCYATGWGKDKFGKQGRYSVILKKIPMPVLDRGVCEEKYRASRLGKWFELDSTFICAGEPGKFTCRGDGGSPLVCPTQTEHRYVQSGIVAWSVGCSGDPPTVFVDVATFRDWIDEKVKAKGLETSLYTI